MTTLASIRVDRTDPETTTENPHRRGKNMFEARFGTYLVVSLIAIVSIFPLYYTIVMASHTNAEMAEPVPPMLPNTTFFGNLEEAIGKAPLTQGLINSLVVSGAVTISTLTLCTLAGFAFSKLEFRGRNLLLGLCIGTMTVPMQMGIIPLYMQMANLGLSNNLLAVILPTAVTAFGVFFMRQYIASSVPDELIEAAVIDGASSLRIFVSVVVPIVRPGMAVLGMITFLTTWNDFFWPIIVLSSQNPTIQVAFQSLATGFTPERSVIMAGTLYGTVPVLIVFALLGKQIVSGIMAGAVKG